MVAPLVLAGQLGLKFLPVIGAVSGALPGLRRGDFGEAALGAGFGAVTGGLGTAGAIKGLTKQGMRLAGSPGVVGGATNLLGAIAPDLADAPVRQALVRAVRAGIPLAGIAGTAKLAGGSGLGGAATRSVSPTLGGAAGLLGYNTIGNEGLGGSPLPLGVGPYGTVGPTGLPLDVLSPLGLEAGRRLRTQKDAESLRDATNIVLPTLRKFSEQAKKDDFARNMASAGIKQNIATNAALNLAMNEAARLMGTTAAQQAGQALTQQYNY